MNRIHGLVAFLFCILLMETGGQQLLKAQTNSVSTVHARDVQLKHLRFVVRTTDLSRVSYIFTKSKSVRVINDQSGPISIMVGDVSDEVLKTKIDSIRFNPIERYNAKEALLLIMQTPGVQRELRRLDLELPLIAVPGLVQEPISHLPHLPTSMRNVTLRAALDKVAETFGGFIIYGGWTIDGTKFFAVDFALAEAFDRPQQRRR